MLPARAVVIALLVWALVEQDPLVLAIMCGPKATVTASVVCVVVL